MDISLINIYELLYKAYGDPGWWPADSPYEVIVGAVLTQNTVWSNVEKAIANFKGTLTPELIEDISVDELTKIIYPAGFFNQKAVYLKEITKWYKSYGYSVANVQKREQKALRKDILAVKGIGKETADSILLYAFGFPSFVVDAYTIRLLIRLGYTGQTLYDNVKLMFETALPRDTELYNRYHALIVVNAKMCCKKKPECSACPLNLVCPKIDI